MPALVKIKLLLHGEEAANLLEEQFELALTQALSIDGPTTSLKATPLAHQLIQHLQALLARALLSQIATEQIKDAVGREREQLLLDRLPLIGQFAHPLKQLQALHQQSGRGLVTTGLLVLPRCIAARQCSEEGEIGFTIAAEGRSLRGCSACRANWNASWGALASQSNIRPATSRLEDSSKPAVSPGCSRPRFSSAAS